MDDQTERWKAITKSQFGWEREALESVRKELPDCDPYRAWANFEFVADDGAVYEVDLLVLTPKGFFLIEIKSWPGPVTGDAHTVTWHPTDGRRPRSYDHPIRLANTKAKKLKSLLERQKAVKGLNLPYLAAKVFLSARDVQPNLDGPGRANVCVRDRDRPGTPQRAYPGILHELTWLSPEEYHRPGWRKVDTPLAKAISRAMEQAGVKESLRSRRVGDWVLGELLADGPGTQDFLAQHASLGEKTRSRIRIFGVGQPGVTAPRDALERAARREFEALRNLPAHAGILRPEGYTESERGPALIFPYDPEAVRLDHFLEQQDASLTVDARLDLLRQLAETVAWAHERGLVHRALSPQSVLVRTGEQGRLTLQVFNWQTVAWANDPLVTRTRTGTAHPDALVEEPALVYMAPEAHTRAGEAGAAADVFSLGAIAFRLFARKPPASDLLDLTERLRSGPGLQLSAAVDGAVPSLVELIASCTRPSVTDRLDSVRDVLVHLELAEEELTTPEPEQTVDPLQATKGDRLDGGFTVIHRLGQGSSAVAFLVERDGVQQVLKVALSTAQNERLREEAEVLAKLDHPRIVRLAGTVEVGERVALQLETTSTETLRDRIQRHGRLAREYLQRFGDDLLAAVGYLEDKGHAHRDIKPDNLSVAPDANKKSVRLVLFDFSLARAPAEQTRLGTPHYLDPFLPARRRWDAYAERWAAAVTLYEMAAGVRPRWGDGESDPAAIEDEVTIESDLFEASLRAGLSAFFAKALRRNFKQRFDNAVDMRQEWRRVFEEADRQSDAADGFDPDAFAGALQQANRDTPLTALPFGARLQEVLERLGAVTVADALSLPASRITTLRGVGNRTRRDLLAAKSLLAEAVGSGTPTPTIVPTPTPTPKPPARRGRASGRTTRPTADEPAAEALPLDVLATRLVPERTGKQGRPASEATLRAQRLWIGLETWPTGTPLDSPVGWASADDVARALGHPRNTVARSLEQAQSRWSKLPELNAVRQALAEAINAFGVTTTAELEAALLAARGSNSPEPLRTAETRAVVRAALEAELEASSPRWALRRAPATVLVAPADETGPGRDAGAVLDWLARLGREADALATAEPLPDPRRVDETLRAIEAPPGAPALPSERLVRLAAAASGKAAASSRLELYPRGLDAARALQLAAGALAGVDRLAPDDLRRRVRARFPEAAPLPEAPEALLSLVAATGLDLIWNQDQRRFEQKSLVSIGLSSKTGSGPPRLDTAGGDRRPVPERELAPEEVDARLLEERLARSAAEGSFLALVVAPRQLDRAARELSRFGVRRVSLEERVLHHLRAVCAQRKVAWSNVLEADAQGPQGKHWGRLQALLRQALEAVSAELLGSSERVLLTEPNVLGRYERVDVLGALRSALDGRTGSTTVTLPGLWVLVPDDGQHEAPVLDGAPVPILGRAQWARLTEAWLTNRHRAGVADADAAPATRTGSAPTGA